MTDVAVVGAGLAGLVAARRLTDSGAAVRVLEARDRVGGRTYTRTVDGDPHDVGAQWVGANHERVLSLAAELGVETVPQHDEGATMLRVAGVSRDFEREWRALPPLAAIDFEYGVWRLERLARRVPLEDPAAADRADAWDRTTAAAWAEGQFHTAAGRATFDAAVRAIFTAEPAELSLLFVLFYLHAGGGFDRLASVEDGAQQYRLDGGTQQLCERLAAGIDGDTATGTDGGLDVSTGMPVRAVEHDGDGVTVVADGATVAAEYVVVAVPPVAADRIDYDPPLPASRADYHQRAPMGNVVKCVATYDAPFWRASYSGEVIADDDVGLVFDASPPSGETGALVAFLLADAAREWADAPRTERKRVVCDRLASYFGDRAASPNDYTDEVWSRGPWSDGCYAAMLPPGVLSRYGARRAEPTGRIHWAGTETATEGYGYMEGAVASGERAAEAVDARL